MNNDHAGASVDILDDKNWSALFYGISNNHLEAVKVLLENKTNVNLMDKNRITPLLLAEQIKDSVQKEKVIILLKKYGAKN